MRSEEINGGQQDQSEEMPKNFITYDGNHKFKCLCFLSSGANTQKINTSRQPQAAFSPSSSRRTHTMRVEQGVAERKSIGKPATLENIIRFGKTFFQNQE